MIVDPKTQKVLIQVTEPGGKGKKKALPPDEPLGMLPGAYPRRKAWHKPPQGKGINIFDGGQVSDGHGGYTDNPYRMLRPAHQLGEFIYPDPLLTSDYDAMLAPMLAVPPANRKTKFRKITPGTAYSQFALTITIGDYSGNLEDCPKFGPGGIIPTQADLDAGIFIGPGFYVLNDSINLTSSSICKITTSPSYAAPVAAFTPSKLMDVFLSPAMTLIAGNALATDTGGTLFSSYDAYYYMIMPRVLGLVGPPFNNWGGSWGDPTGAPIDTGIGGYTRAYTAYSLLSGFEGGRGFVHHFSSLDPWTPGAFPYGAFPAPPALPHYTGLPPWSRYFQYSAGGLGSDYTTGQNGILVAIVEKAGVSYYFWTDNR